MQRIEFDPSRQDKWSAEQKASWAEWSRKADIASARIKDLRRTSIDFDSRIWAELKDWLLTNVFNGKCAYCDTKIDAGFYDDAEHYRPKSGVRISAGSKRKPVVKNGTKHPGYYWLAYTWSNLVPSCQHCNNKKRDAFPVLGSHVFGFIVKSCGCF
jgi:5-methylcytosine-specific restriction endonuclease McrA